jgi:hypothetical protein
MLDKLGDHGLVTAVMERQFNCEFGHVLAKESHPRRAIGLFETTSCGQRSAAVKDTNIIKAEKASFKNVFAKLILPVHPPGEVEEQFIECRFYESHIHRAALCKL